MIRIYIILCWLYWRWSLTIAWVEYSVLWIFIELCANGINISANGLSLISYLLSFLLSGQFWTWVIFHFLYKKFFHQVTYVSAYSIFTMLSQHWYDVLLLILKSIDECSRLHVVGSFPVQERSNFGEVWYHWTAFHQHLSLIKFSLIHPAIDNGRG